MADSTLSRDQQQFGSALLQNLPGIVYRCKYDSNWSIDNIQGICEPITGYSAAELIQNKQSIRNLIIESYREKYLLKWLTCLNNKTIFQDEYLIITKDGSNKWVSEQGVGIYNEHGQVIAIEGFITDITERKLAELALFNEKERLRITLQSIGDGVITTDEHGKITMLNQVAEEITGWAHEHAIGRDFDEVFNIFDETTNCKCASPIQQVLETHEVVKLSPNTVLIAKDGVKRFIGDTAAPIKDAAGKILGIVVVFRDVTQERLQAYREQYTAFHDVLTGLHNRAYFEDTLSSMNEPDTLPISIIFGDLNGLKLTNDVFGHQEGDQLLVNIGRILKRFSGEKGIVARYGGDEFSLLLPNTSEQEAEKICKEIKLACKEAKHEPISLNIALGYATKNRVNDNIYDILNKAEEDMYSKKLVESKEFQRAIIASLTKLLKSKSSETEEHTRRMVKLSFALGKAFGLAEPNLEELRLLAVLHDIGNISIKNSILGKPGSLTESEWQEIKKHPQTGFRIAQTSPELVHIADAILSHHERWDGQGYPQGLSNRDIPLISRMLAIVDAYEAMTGYRVYKQAISHEAAMNEIERNSGSQFDPYLVNLFIKIMDEQPELREIDASTS